MATLFTNIRCLCGIQEQSTLLRGDALAQINTIDDAYLLVENGRIAAFGPMHSLALAVPQLPNHVVDLANRFVLPAWCDSHSHLVFAKSREHEFVAKIKGESYAQIAAKGGGILNSARALQEAPEELLLELAKERLQQAAATGTGAIEIKSGYGLTLAAELKMLRVIKQLKAESDLIIKSTLLAAHAYPREYANDHEGYLSMIINDMLPRVADEKLADFVDVFCEKGFFSVDDMQRVCEAAAKYGLRPKLHVNQLNSIGGLQAGIALGALSLDHLETMTATDIADLAASDSIGTMLPTAAFFLRMPYQPARQMIDTGCAVALASDFNPGSSPGSNMNFVQSLACIQMKMLPEEAINASSINGAFAMDVQDDAGSISIGKKANLIITKPIPSLAYLPYSFSESNIEQVMLGGNFVGR